MLDIFIGRQPIYDRKLEVYAYELLYRSSERNFAGPIDGDQATSQVIMNAFMELDLEQIVGEHLAFINLTRGFIVGDHALPLPRGKLVVEILEDIEVDPPLIAAVQDLSSRGYLIALDDFIFHEALRPLVDLADIVKIDVRRLDRPTVAEHVRELRRHTAKLLAEKVETQEEYDHYRKLGFDYFQGYFFARPNIVKGQRMPANRVAVLRLLSKLQDPKVSVQALEELISQDVSLSYKLLRYINSAFFALPRKVESIHQAVVYLGNRTIKTWAALIALSNIHDKPHELVTLALVRAKMCELLARSLNLPNEEIFFTVGMFSALDALMDVPMQRVLKDLPLSEDIVGALLRREGPPGAALHCALAYEQGDWGQVSCGGMDIKPIRQAYLDAIAWADDALRQLPG